MDWRILKEWESRVYTVERIDWLYASINSELKAGIISCGRLDSKVTQNQPGHPINVADDLRCSRIRVVWRPGSSHIEETGRKNKFEIKK